MIALSDYPLLTPEQYLELEALSSEKHEYINGEVYAMAGTTDLHNLILGNLYTSIRQHLRGKTCQVYFADLKVRIAEKNCFYYPDLLVTCNPQDLENLTYKCFPKLIVEVLSDSTEAFDRGAKFNDYQSLESLEEYVLVNCKLHQVEIYRYCDQYQWKYDNYMLDRPQFTLTSIQLDLSLDEVYEDVDIILEAQKSD